jgi:inner membrane protein
MDSVTQLLFGGVLGAAGFRKSLGRRAVAAGGLIGTLPDLDVLTGLFGHQSVVDTWQDHRAISHSFPATLIYGAAVGWMLWKAERLRSRAPNRPALGPDDSPERRRNWMWLGALAAVTHPLIDLFTAYGTQLLAPFSSVRFAINAMPIIDPVYSLPLLLVFLFALVSERFAAAAQRAAQLALVYIFLYTTMAWGIGLHLEQRAREELQATSSNTTGVRISAYPVIFQPWWRRIVVDLPDEILIGFASPFTEKPIAWQRFARLPSSPALDAAQASYEAKVFRWFSGDHLHWTVKPGTPTLVEARDYRYGMPGDSILGFWGLRFRVDAAGRLLGEPERLSERPGFTRAGLAEIRDGVLGR